MLIKTVINILLILCVNKIYATTNELIDKRTSDCSRLVERYAKPAKAFLAKFPLLTKKQNSSVIQLASAAIADCDSPRQALAINSMVSGLQNHSGRVGILLPLSGSSAKQGKSILEGIRASYPNSALERLVIRDNASDVKINEERLAQLILDDDISMIIGGFPSNTANFVQYWSEALAIPSLIVSTGAAFNEKSRFSFQVYPRPEILTDVLSNSATSRGLKKIAMINPRSQSGYKFREAFAESLKKKGLRIAAAADYISGDFSSMLEAAASIFNTKPSLRVEDFQELLKLEKERAEESGSTVSLEKLQLKPKYDFDAVFIPDNIKNVRHLVKIFQFLGVRKIPLLGSYEWRSEALLNPSESFLDGSIFADFIGSYSKLSPIVSPPKTSSFFANSEDLEALDYRIIGWRAAELSKLNLMPGSKRSELTNKLKLFKDLKSSYFDSLSAFDERQQSFWPASVFAIAGKQIVSIGHSPTR